MRLTLKLLICACMMLTTPSIQAGEPVAASSMQDQINQKYRNYFGPDSQILLPFPTMEMKDWKNIRAQKVLRRIYSEPDKFYNGKTYTFTLYQATDDNSYYLDAKGGFWGMDELLYGPIDAKDLQ